MGTVLLLNGASLPWIYRPDSQTHFKFSPGLTEYCMENLHSKLNLATSGGAGEQHARVIQSSRRLALKTPLKLET